MSIDSNWGWPSQEVIKLAGELEDIWRDQASILRSLRAYVWSKWYFANSMPIHGWIMHDNGCIQKLWRTCWCLRYADMLVAFLWSQGPPVLGWWLEWLWWGEVTRTMGADLFNISEASWWGWIGWSCTQIKATQWHHMAPYGTHVPYSMHTP